MIDFGKIRLVSVMSTLNVNNSADGGDIFSTNTFPESRDVYNLYLYKYIFFSSHGSNVTRERTFDLTFELHIDLIQQRPVSAMSSLTSNNFATP